MRLARLAVVAIATLTAGLPMPARSGARPVAIDGPAGRLHGTLLVPATSARANILILAGSGPTDRDGNQPGVRNDSLKQLAEALTAAGLITLRADKRGVGVSAIPGMQEADLRFEDFVADAVLWLDFLCTEGRPVMALGHSEGALVATLAAARTPVAGLVLVAGPGFPVGPTLRRQLAASGLPAAKLAEAEAMLTRIEAGETFADVPADWMALFRPSVQPYMISWARHDPAAALAWTTPPTLVIQGSTDLQTTAADAERLAAARAGIELVMIDGMNHVMKAAPLDRPANVATYLDPALPIRPEVPAAIARFVGGIAP